MKVAITGGYGYIGSRIAERLLIEGHEVTILDIQKDDTKRNLDKCHFIQCDITNYKTLPNFSNNEINVLMHLAAQSSGEKSFEIPETDININILGTLNMIKWCGSNNVKRILFASSFTVYGDNTESEIYQEDMPCNPKSLYALSKYTGEKYLQIYGEHIGIEWNILRMFNVYGPGQDLTRMDQGVVSIFLSMIHKGDYVGVKGSLDRFRDLVFIDDVVEGWMQCLHQPEHSNKIFNLGSGIKTTIADLIDTIIEVYGKTGKVKVEEIGNTPGDIMGCYADISKITEKLGYSPRYDLKVGIKRFKEWADEFC